MSKRDVAELKKRLTKSGATFTRIAGCYVDSNKNIVTRINENFLNLEEEEFYKYLEIAKKTLSGSFGNNILELDFPKEAEEAGGKQQFLMGLKESGLKNDALLDRFFELIIENYNYVGNYLILLFHDAYDVMTKTSDNNKLDESEEVYEYLLCSICPVVLTKPGLGYREDLSKIAPRIRDWIVSVPENGFVFPAFRDRSTDIHSTIYFTRNTKDPNHDFMTNGIGCGSKRTATEQKEVFHTIVRDAIPADEDDDDELLMEIQENINFLIEDNEVPEDVETEPVLLTSNTIQTILSDSGISEEIATKIEQNYTEEFGDTPPAAEYLVDTKALAANAHKKKERELVKEVESLKQQIVEKNLELGIDDENRPACDVIIKVKPDKVPLIKSDIIDGQKCLIVPIDEDEQATVNGVNTPL